MRITTKELAKIVAEAGNLEYIGAKGAETTTSHADMLSVKAGMLKSGAYGTMQEIDRDLCEAMSLLIISAVTLDFATESANPALFENGVQRSMGPIVHGLVRR